ncbi:MAG: (Fe-S)-binding protein [Candidatus Fermentibacteria bacterium]
MKTILTDFLRKALTSGSVTSVMVPSRGPESSFPWTLVTDVSALSQAEPVPPVMSIQGAKALASFTQSETEGKLLAVMRPCEARAAVELSKLKQVSLQNIIFLTMDCPGAVPLMEYRRDNDMETDITTPDTLRPLCRQCTEFTSTGDLCLAMHGGLNSVLPLTPEGQILLDSLGIKPESDTSAWKEWTASLRSEREAISVESTKSLKDAYSGLEGLIEVFSGCISCRSCRTVCPICYCRLCFIDMKDRRSPASEYLERSRSSGSARLMPDTLLFHIGRMAHMSLSCVSCGMCEDACPSDIPVGRLVSMVSAGTTAVFDYRAGSDPEDPLPLNTFRMEELHEYED